MLFEELDLEFEFPILFICGTKIINGKYIYLKIKRTRTCGQLEFNH